MNLCQNIDSEISKSFRVEKDCIGECEIADDLYYGIHTQRALDNFYITGQKPHRQMIIAVAEIKKACAMTNFEASLLNQETAEAIIKAADLIINGEYHQYFVVDPIQGGAGTSHNMNANEVIANIALKLSGKKIGEYSYIHPNDHVNMGQSTNDVYPSCGKIAMIRLFKKLEAKLAELEFILKLKSLEFDNVIKMGRTQMQDAVPIRLGQEFAAYKSAVSRNREHIIKAVEQLSYINMGATAIGTGLNADLAYFDRIIPNLSKVTALDLKRAEDLIDSTQNTDCFVYCSGIIKSVAVSLSKIAHDLRLMSSGPTCGLAEINLPERQAGSSIMPAKVNPVIPELMSQVSFYCMGVDSTVAIASQSGQLELNPFEPIIFYSIFSALEYLVNAVDSFAKNCIEGITANADKTKKMVENSYGIITAFAPHIGYEKSVEIAHVAKENGLSIKETLLQYKILTEEQINSILDSFAMTTPGIVAKNI